MVFLSLSGASRRLAAERAQKIRDAELAAAAVAIQRVARMHSAKILVQHKLTLRQRVEAEAAARAAAEEEARLAEERRKAAISIALVKPVLTEEQKRLLEVRGG